MLPYKIDEMSGKEEYVGITEFAKRHGVTVQTVRRWADEGKVPCKRIGGGRRLIPVDLDREPEIGNHGVPREKFFYCRVSSSKQKDDLERQVKEAQQLYPEHRIIRDIGSGLNWKRKGIVTLLERTIRGEVEEIVVFHRDRLCRFGFDLVSLICKESNTRIVVVDEENFRSPQEELVQDVLSVITVFACKEMGKRRYKTSAPSQEAASQESAGKRGRGRPKRGGNDPKKQKDSDIPNEESEEATSSMDEGCPFDL